MIPFINFHSFGHWINDGLTAIVSLPQWVWDLDPVLVSKVERGMILEHMKAVGLGHIQVIFPGNYVYGEHVFLCKGGECYNSFGLHSYPEIRKRFQQYYELDKVKPVNYFFVNKEKGIRHFPNYPEIIEAARLATNINWVEKSINYRDRRETAITYASCKILVIPCGSLTFNAIFLHNRTGIVSLMGDNVDYPQLKLTTPLNIWVIGIIHKNISHRGGHGNGDLERIVINLKRMIYTIENQRFPPVDYFHPYNLDLAWQIYFQHGDLWRFSKNDIVTFLPKLVQNYRDSFNKTKAEKDIEEAQIRKQRSLISKMSIE